MAVQLVQLLLNLAKTGMAAYSHYDTLKNRKFDLLEGEQLVKQGIALWGAFQGSLCLTNKRLRFESSGEKVDGYLSYPVDAIVSVKLHSRGIEIEFSDGRKETMIASQKEDWAEKILNVRKFLSGPETVEKTIDGTVLDPNKVALRKNITAYFSENEMQTLCFDLGIEYENLSGTTKEAKARELVIHCERNGSLLKLLKQCQRLRPHVEWL